MTMRRMAMTAGGAVLPAVVIALVFGNRWVSQAMREAAGPDHKGAWQLINRLRILQWELYPQGGMGWGGIIAVDFGLLLTLVLLAALAAVGARTVDPERGVLGAFLTGWWACFVAVGIGGVITGVLLGMVTLGEPKFYMISAYITNGAAFGFLYGWTSGLGALAGFHLGRDRATGAAQPMRQPYQPQPGAPTHQQMPPVQGGQPMPGQQPYPPQSYVPPQHPAAVPYVPPQGGPQQPAWGGAPQVPAVPPQPPAPPAASASPAPDAPTPDPPTYEDDPPTRDDDAPTPGDVRDGDDLADKTMLDHDPDTVHERGAGDEGSKTPPAT